MDKILDEIAANQAGRADLLREVMVERYNEFKAAGVFGNEPEPPDPTDDDDEDEDEDDDKDTDKIDPKVVGAIEKAVKKSKSDEGSESDSEDEITVKENDTDGLAEDIRGRLDDDDDEEDDEEEKDASLIPKTYGKKQSKFSSIVNLQNATLATGVLTDLLNLTTFGNMGMTMDTLFAGSQAEQKQKNDKYATSKTVNSAISLASNAISGTMNFINFLDKGFKSTNNRRKSNQLSAGAATNAFGLMANGSKALSSIISIWGDPKNKNKGSFNFFNVFGGIMGTAASASTLVGDILDKRERGKIIESIDKLKLSGDNDKSGEQEKQFKNQVRKMKRMKKVSPIAYKNAKASYRSFKAKKYTLQDAKEFQQLKKSETTKGITSTITNGLSTCATIFTLIPGIGDKITGTVGALTGPLAYISNTVAKYVGIGRDQKNKGKIASKKAEIVGKYLERKRAKIAKQASHAFRKRNDVDDLSNNLTDNEKDRIVFGRLTSPVSVDDTPIDEAQKTSAFTKLNIKRARNIMQIDERSRNRIFEALHLSKNATIDELASALEGD